ncbi:hypothetical protein JRO89_XS13G0117100 [Xanthoceras sorbifolium]|uniref:CCHC-type domain-containing protein n=1 Tax=Xanthoceras sorbifolium TaxID=99658 RepID=A0ABQ8H7W7_9ROSI|nr:hypothetical protein JRO89_XS13G0117100 [Xanthoceras sorbifolium]
MPPRKQAQTRDVAMEDMHLWEIVTQFIEKLDDLSRRMDIMGTRITHSNTPSTDDEELRASFLPHNYLRLLYQKLQNLRQGSRFVDDYRTEFHWLIARNNLAETEEQMVARYIGGLGVQFQDMLNLFDPYSITEAHQRALQLEKQLSRRTGVAFGSTHNNGRSLSNAPPQARNVSNLNPSGPINNATGNNQGHRNPIVNSGIRCFTCGETGHRMTECKKGGKYGKWLFIENEDQMCDMEDEEQDVDNDAHSAEELVERDSGTMLVVRRAYFAPKKDTNGR